MKDIVKFFGFLIALILIFWIENFGILALLILLNLLVIRILKLDIRKFINRIKILLPFILFTTFLNVILEELRLGILIGLRLLLAYSITYLFSKTMTSLQIASVIKKLIYPLKIFKINPNNVEIMICISFCIIPILKTEIQQKKYALKAKGFQTKWSNIFIIMKPLFISILRRTSEMEKALMAKGYEE